MQHDTRHNRIPENPYEGIVFLGTGMDPSRAFRLMLPTLRSPLYFTTLDEAIAARDAAKNADHAVSDEARDISAERITIPEFQPHNTYAGDWHE